MELSGGFYSPISRPQTPQPPVPALAPVEGTTAPGDAPPDPISGAPGPVPAPATAAGGSVTNPTLVQSPTLDQELATVMKGLGSFWGKVRKQSVEVYQTANTQLNTQLETARKDLTPLVAQARGHLDQFSENTKAELARLSEAGNAGGGGAVVIGADGMPIIMEDVVAVDKKGKGVDRSEEQATGEGEKKEGDTEGEGGASSTTAKEGEEPTPAAQASAFFSKLQSQLSANPNLTQLSKNLSTIQSNLSTLPNSLQTNLNQLQTQFAHIDLSETKHTAEGYLHKSENWLTDFGNEVAKLAKDAVKVVPPNEAARERKREEALRKAEQGAAGRKEALIQRLRSDPAILLVDPAKPPPSISTSTTGEVNEEPQSPTADTREEFAKFLSAIEDKGGLEGDDFAATVKKELAAGGESLGNMLSALVPKVLTKEAFWSRYFFRVGQIESEEKRRKQLFEEAAGKEEDDFSWDMEDEDSEAGDAPDRETTPAPPTALTSAPVTVAPVAASAAATLSAAAPVEASLSATSTAAPSLSSSTPAPSTPTPDNVNPSSSTATSDVGDWGSIPPSPTSPTAPISSSHSMDKTSSTSSAGAKGPRGDSPRASSDGASSYDVVGMKSGNPSEADPNEKITKKEEESDEDSDWE